MIKHKKTGKWLEPGGHIEPNEDPDAAAIRETYEETGVHVELIGDRLPTSNDFTRPLALQKHIVAEGHMHIDIVYLAYPIEPCTLHTNTEETDGVKWFSTEEITANDFNTFDDVKFWCKKIQLEKLNDVS